MNQNRVVDLRSDTVTLPTEEMREAMCNAKLGDDVYEEDPTVNKLERMAAEKLGTEAALLVTSGTQGNITALTMHTERGQEVILGRNSHIYNHEVSSMAVIADLLPRPLEDANGALDPREVEQLIKEEGLHHTKTGLICAENTHNRAGGVAVPPERIQEISEVAESHNIPFHLDGARIFNAAIALDVSVKDFTKHVDSVMFCLSKGLSAPVGSLLAGSKNFIEKARQVRKMLGGGMRQAGIIAAPGIVALEKMIDRLEEDHKTAQFLARELNKMEGIQIDVPHVDTNIVIADVSGLDMSSSEFVSRMDEEGVKFLSLSAHPPIVRLVTHRGITWEDVKYAVRTIKNTIGK